MEIHKGEVLSFGPKVIGRFQICRYSWQETRRLDFLVAAACSAWLQPVMHQLDLAPKCFVN